jgi:alpha-tubulin suppressor-like RCC1 family protein
VLAWGAGSIGQLGDGSTAASGTPVPVSLPPGTTVRAISTGAFHALALTTTGEVLAWGENDLGQLGDGSVADQHTPVRTRLPACGSSPSRPARRLIPA